MAKTSSATLAPARVTPRPARADRPPSRRRVRLTPYLLIIPSCVIIGGLLLWPIIQLVRMSFQQVGLPQIRANNPLPAESVGTDNYRQILESEVFWHSLRNTVGFAAAAVAGTLILGTLVGLLLHRLGRRMSTFVAVGLMLAWATPQITSAVVWSWLFDAGNGLVNWALNLLPDGVSQAVFGRAEWSQHPWFVETWSVYLVLFLCVVWMSVPFIAVAVLAGLTSIPGELHEAARVDGSGPWRTFWSITYPMMKPIFGVLTVLSIIWDFKVFTQLYVLAGGLVNRDAANLSLYAYAEAFSPPQKMGLGSAIAVVLTVILLIITAVYVRQIARQEELA